ncbi:MAG TPA: hypothetical protein VJH75_00200 [Patescibacteria group bacterium]|nr:hypothetical protein [Patescibacteria group bacterium]
MGVHKKGTVTKETYEDFLRAYLELVKKVEELEKDEAALHHEILAAIDRKKMKKIVDRINKIRA